MIRIFGPRPFYETSLFLDGRCCCSSGGRGRSSRRSLFFFRYSSARRRVDLSRINTARSGRRACTVALRCLIVYAPRQIYSPRLTDPRNGTFEYDVYYCNTRMFLGVVTYKRVRACVLFRSSFEETIRIRFATICRRIARARAKSIPERDKTFPGEGGE